MNYNCDKDKVKKKIVFIVDVTVLNKVIYNSSVHKANATNPEENFDVLKTKVTEIQILSACTLVFKI